MKINSKIASIVEVIGLLIVVLSIGWQVFAEDNFQDDARRNEMIQLNIKLDNIWLYLGKIGIATTDDETSMWVTDYEVLNEQWQYVNQENNFDEVARASSLIRGILFLIGTAMLSFGRYYELQERNKTDLPKTKKKSRK